MSALHLTLVVLACLASNALTKRKGYQYTKVLDEDNWSEFVTGRNVLVDFYAPWCGRSKQLEPDFEMAAKKVSEYGISARLAKVDCDDENSAGLKEAFQVEGYPYLLFINKTGDPHEYSGGTDAESIFTWLKNAVDNIFPVETNETAEGGDDNEKLNETSPTEEGVDDKDGGSEASSDYDAEDPDSISPDAYKLDDALEGRYVEYASSPARIDKIAKEHRHTFVFIVDKRSTDTVSERLAGAFGLGADGAASNGLNVKFVFADISNRTVGWDEYVAKHKLEVPTIEVFEDGELKEEAEFKGKGRTGKLITEWARKLDEGDVMYATAEECENPKFDPEMSIIAMLFSTPSNMEAYEAARRKAGGVAIGELDSSVEHKPMKSILALMDQAAFWRAELTMRYWVCQLPSAPDGWDEEEDGMWRPTGGWQQQTEMVREGSIWLHKQDEPPFVWDEPKDGTAAELSESLGSVIRRNAVPVKYLRGKDDMDNIDLGVPRNPSTKTAANPTGMGATLTLLSGCYNMTSLFHKWARQVMDEFPMQFVPVCCTSEGASHVAQTHLSIPGRPPTLMAVHDNAKTNRREVYAMPNEEHTLDTMMNFVRQIYYAERSPYVKSEKVPEDDSSTLIKKVVGQTYDGKVLDPKKEALVVFTAAGLFCEECPALLAGPVKKLAAKVRGKKDVIIAHLDTNTNEIPHTSGLGDVKTIDEVIGFPAIVYYAKGARKEPVVYTRKGKKTYERLLAFLTKGEGGELFTAMRQRKKDEEAAEEAHGDEGESSDKEDDATLGITDKDEL